MRDCPFVAVQDGLLWWSLLNFPAFSASIGMGVEGLRSESNRTTTTCSSDADNSKAVLPRRSGMLRLGSYCSNGNLTLPSRPPTAALRSGVRPFLVPAVLRSTPSRSNRNLTILPYRRSAGHQRGVQQYLASGVLGLMSSSSNSNLAIPSYPCSAARQRGV